MRTLNEAKRLMYNQTIKNKAPSWLLTMLAVNVGRELAKEYDVNENIVVLDADLSGATKTNMFSKKFPERFFNMGIAEQDMIGTAAGFATCSKIPYASSFAVFAAMASCLASSACFSFLSSYTAESYLLLTHTMKLTSKKQPQNTITDHNQSLSHSF